LTFKATLSFKGGPEKASPMRLARQRGRIEMRRQACNHQIMNCRVSRGADDEPNSIDAIVIAWLAMVGGAHAFNDGSYPT
jgi:hypothetical protein